MLPDRHHEVTVAGRQVPCACRARQPGARALETPGAYRTRSGDECARMAVQDHETPGPHRPHTEGVSPAGENHQQMETPELLRRWRRDGDAAAREAVVERFLPLARQLARRYQRANEPFDDLVQVASMGLVKAVDRFDTERGVAFSSYAVPTVLGELKRYFRDVGWAAHVPRGMQERVMRVEQASRSLRGRDGRSPSVAQLADCLLYTSPSPQD